MICHSMCETITLQHHQCSCFAWNIHYNYTCTCFHWCVKVHIYTQSNSMCYQFSREFKVNTEVLTWPVDKLLHVLITVYTMGLYSLWLLCLFVKIHAHLKQNLYKQIWHCQTVTISSHVVNKPYNVVIIRSCHLITSHQYILVFVCITYYTYYSFNCSFCLWLFIIVGYTVIV